VGSLWGVLAPLSPVALQQDADGGSFVEVNPQGIGKLKLVLDFVYNDCAIQEVRVDVNVGAPEQAPEKFVLVWTNWHDVRKGGTAHLDFADFSSVVLTPLAFYKGVDSPVAVLGDDVAFTVLTRKKVESPISFDPSFRGVHSLQVGQALIKATFRGLSAYTCIDVTPDARTASRGSDCHGIDSPDRSQAIEKR
jgi:hypothetical protein